MSILCMSEHQVPHNLGHLVSDINLIVNITFQHSKLKSFQQIRYSAWESAATLSNTKHFSAINPEEFSLCWAVFGLKQEAIFNLIYRYTFPNNYLKKLYHYSVPLLPGILWDWQKENNSKKNEPIMVGIKISSFHSGEKIFYKLGEWLF
jgi:hypothetical protein